MPVKADNLVFGDAISQRLIELAALSDETGRLTRLYLGPPIAAPPTSSPIGCAMPA